MLRIRLTRRGKRNQAFFRLVVAEAKRPIKGRFIENLGFFNPHTKETKLISERILYWLAVGAKPSVTVHNLLIKHSIIKGQKIKNFGPKKTKAKEKPAEVKSPAQTSLKDQTSEKKE